MPDPRDIMGGLAADDAYRGEYPDWPASTSYPPRVPSVLETGEPPRDFNDYMGALARPAPDTLAPPPRSDLGRDVPAFLGKQVFPNLSNPDTYATPSAALTPNNQGKVPTANPLAMGAAADIGNTLNYAIPFGGPLKAAPAAAAGLKAIFAGVAAKTADRVALAQAQRMAASGADRAAIWDATGWFQGADDKWLFEISDNTSTISPKIANRLNKNIPMMTDASRTLEHPELYQAYPALKKMTMYTELSPERYGVFMNPEVNGRRWSPLVQAKGPTVDDVRNVALHEMQHPVQEAEGLAPGGNAESHMLYSAPEVAPYLNMRKVFESAYKAESAKPNPDAARLQRIQSELNDLNPLIEKAAGLAGYKRLAGEVQARNVHARMNMTPQERRATPPWLTQDVPTEQQIIMGSSAGNEPQRSVSGKMGDLAEPNAGIRGYHSSPHDLAPEPGFPLGRFNYDKFKFTGEGANMMGPGTYIGGSEKVSGRGGHYWNQFLSKFEEPEANAARRLQAEGWDRARALTAAQTAESYWGKKFTGASAYGVPSDLKEYGRMRDLARVEAELLRGGKPVGPRTYEVNINARPEQMLDWDKPLAQQSAAIRELLQQATSPQGLAHALPSNAENAGGFAQRGAAVDQSQGFVNRPSGGVVGEGMGSVADYGKVGNPVVGLSPVDVMDIFKGQQRSANVGGHDASVLLGLPPVKGGNPVAANVGAANSSSGGVAGVPAEGSFVSGRRGPVEGFPTIPADQFGHVMPQDFLRKFPDPKSAAEALSRQGISGIRYLDAGSRSGSLNPTYNHVIFPGNEHLVEILKKYGIAGAAPAGLGALASQEQYEQ